MEQGCKPSVAVIGAGPAGCMCAMHLQKACDVVLFDLGKPLRTLLPTGGGRCNFAHAEYDFKELAKNYPRGEKFLYSVFSRFSTSDTLEFFEKLGLEYYTQDNGRIFPKSNSAKEVREKFLNRMKKSTFVQEKVVDIIPEGDKYKVVTEDNTYVFDKVVIATGTHFGLQFFKKLGVDTKELRPALCGLVTKNNFSTLKGVVLKGVELKFKKIALKGDMLFTDNGISGPVVFELSSYNSRELFPYKIKIKFLEDVEKLSNALELGKDKLVKNVLHKFLPKSFVDFLLMELKIDKNLKCKQLQTNTKVLVLEYLLSANVVVVGARKGGETVFSGGLDLKELGNNFELKKHKNMYVCGEILDVDGLCGGFNLQNAWSSGYLTASAILKTM